MDPGCPKCSELGLALEQKTAEVDRLESDLAEFRAVSHDFEAELQTDLQRLEARDRTMQLELNQLAAENALLQGRLRKLNEESTSNALALQDARANHQRAESEWLASRRALEQVVDDLQRRERELTSLAANLQEDLENQQEQALFLQEALETSRAEAQAEQHVAQRLREQLRDGIAELAVNRCKKRAVSDGEVADGDVCSHCRHLDVHWPGAQATTCAPLTLCCPLEVAEGLLRALQSVMDRSDALSTHLARAYAECGALLEAPTVEPQHCDPS
eukprot:GGOE01020640.1.p1 GENE.GGOE01020640.1~~GGOE01020640.1.p1  ORF type:complete len:274 (+),score=45.14 GGOE01020640.1:47-868(+)